MQREADAEALVVRSHGLRLRAVRAETREADFTASTEAVDSYDEIVEQSWNLSRFLANPVVLFAHNSRDLPIGQCSRCEVVNGALECTIKFASAEANPMAEQVWRLVQEKCLRAVSVGFVPNTVRMEKRDGMDVCVLADNELHEISVVPVPANPEALAKMRARARETATKAPAPAGTENAMTEQEIKALQDKVLQREAEVRTAEKSLADANTKVAALEAQNTALAAERDALKAKAEQLSAEAIEREVEAIVGKKILPAEKELFVELAKSNRDLFTKMVAQRSDLKILGGPVVPPEQQQENTATQDPTGDDLAAEAAKLAGKTITA